MRAFLLVVLIVAGITPGVSAGARVEFDRDIRPILSDKCFQCHGPDNAARETELRLDLRAGLFRTLESESVVLPGNANNSQLFERITSSDPDERMPPPESKNELTADEIQLIREWIEGGAEWEGHWAFAAVKHSKLPIVQQTRWSRTAIDRFILSRLEREKLAPSNPAAKERLIRTASLDLAGLPPTLSDVERFVADDAPDAWERVVDRLLASPRFGERMAWDWLDAARYADTNGYQGDRERTMWPWRDWVVDAFNSNLPYDQFTRWQLAGDRLPNPSFEQKLATGFCRNHMINGEGGRIAEENRIEYIFDQVETTGTIWLGLTFNCCRCHDHKFDPLQQKDYYGLFAFFNQTPITGGGGDPQTPPVLAVSSESQSAELKVREAEVRGAAGDWDRLERERYPRGKSESVSKSTESKSLPEAIRTALDVPVLSRKTEHFDSIEKHFAKDEPLLKASQRIRNAIKRRDDYKRSFPRVMIMEDRNEIRKTFVLTKGLYNQPTDEAVQRIPVVFKQPPVETPDRRVLADWLVDPANPLPARVTTNRFWQTIFGTGLVKTVDDFGAQGEKPSHPQLLDWLAGEFIRTGWDVKQTFRTMLVSSTYQQSAHVTSELLSRDPNNRLLGRAPRYRLPSWMLRDQALLVSGLMVGSLGGPSVKPYQPEGIWSEATFGKKKYQQDTGEKLYRRTLYTYWRRIVGPTMLFDNAKRQTCSVTGSITNTPLHALVTLNETTFVEAARAMAQRLLESDLPNDAVRVDEAFRLATARRPVADEREILLGRLNKFMQQYSAEPIAADELLSNGESGRNQSLDAVTHAAWTGLCLLILNLDETLTR
jgi:hypothetical protein